MQKTTTDRTGVLLRSARRRLAILYVAGIGGELVRLDLRFAIDEIDAALDSLDR